MNKKNLHEIIIDFLTEKQGCVATLKEIYQAVKTSDYETTGKTIDCSTRTVIYRSNKITRVGKGIYMLKGAKSCSLLLNGDSRQMNEIEDNAIDLIITDHPWSDNKAHKSGNQKNFADYETFSYKQEDFDAKARVLKKGAYLVEFLPVESASNWKYIADIKMMAQKAGFEYYASCIWRKAPEGTINNGRTTKGVEQFIIFSKGKPRRLAPKGKPYMTKQMLSYEVDMPIKISEKVHQAEKPIPLYKYLIENFTEEEEFVLDQFGGSCNITKAAVETNRFGIAYELSKKFVEKAVSRFKMKQLYTPEDYSEHIQESQENQTTEIPKVATEFQLKFLNTLRKSSKHYFLNDEEWESIDNAETIQINELFCKANMLGYAEYKKPVFDIDFTTYLQLKEEYNTIDSKFEASFEPYTRPFYENVRIENQCYAEFKAKHTGGIIEYLSYLKKYWPDVNTERTKRILSEHLYIA